MKIVRLEAKNHRGINRINEHGDTFEFKRSGFFNGEKAILVKALDSDWLGWFTFNEIEIIEESC